LDQAKYYGYHVNGPFELNEGQHFDPDKILFDPYTPAVYFPPHFRRHSAIEPGSNAGNAPFKNRAMNYLMMLVTCTVPLNHLKKN